MPLIGRSGVVRRVGGLKQDQGRPFLSPFDSNVSLGASLALITTQERNNVDPRNEIQSRTGTLHALSPRASLPRTG